MIVRIPFFLPVWLGYSFLLMGSPHLMAQRPLYEKQENDRNDNEIIYNYYMQEHSFTTAAGAFLSHSYVHLSFSNRFFIKEYVEKELSYFHTRKKDKWRGSLRHSGLARYGKMVLSFSYARALTPQFGLGIGIDYLMEHAFQYDYRHSLTFELSFQSYLGEKWIWGISLYNPARLKYGFTGTSVIPMSLRINLAHRFTGKILYYAAIEKWMPGHLDIGVGMAYHYASFIVSGNVGVRSAGLTFRFRFHSLLFQISSFYNYKLGFSPLLEGKYLFK